MNAENLILAILGALPNHEVRGKKRLQKLAFFVVQTGIPSNVKFFLHDFGPFSTEVASATDVLSYVGAITEAEGQFEKTKRYYKIYSLPDPVIVSEKLPANALSILTTLNAYSTVELEIASTIRYFLSVGYGAEGAIKATRELKPSKSLPKIVERAEEALLKVGLYERGRTDQMSG